VITGRASRVRLRPATVHGVFSRARRAPFLVLAAVVLSAVTAGCGPDLGRAYYERTTVPAEPGSGGTGQVPDGPITDSAVSLEALRSVDPCALMTAEKLAVLGTAGAPRPDGWSGCDNEVRDPGGKTIELSLEIGEYVIGGADEATGSLEGLPRIEREQDAATCFVTVLTSKDPAIGITAQVGYPGGDPCRPGRNLLQQVITTLRAEPPTLPSPAGSLVAVDPCAVLGDDVAARELGAPVEKAVTGIHGCTWRGEADLAVDFRLGFAPAADGEATEIQLGEVTAVQEIPLPDTASCRISWRHRATEGDQGEIVAVNYDNYGADAATDDSCGRTRRIAEDVLGAISSG
jgi:hypothetical protein